LDPECAHALGNRIEEVFLAAEQRSDGDTALRVSDLLRQVDFGLEAVGGARGLDGPIKGVHLSELEDPTPWMRPRSILLSTGLRFQEYPESGARLIRTLSRANMAALVVALGHYVTAVPQCMTDEADRLGMPLLLAPFDLPFQRIATLVYDVLLSEEMYRLRRTIGVQDHLVGLLLKDRGLERLLESISDLLKATVFLMDASGALVSVAGATSTVNSETADAYYRGYLEAKRRPDRSLSFVVGGHTTAYREVLVGERLGQVLLAVNSEGDPLLELGSTTLFYTQKLLSLRLMKDQDRMMLEEELRSALLDDLIAGAGTETEFTQRMRHFALDPERQWRLAICAVRDLNGSPQAGQGSEEQSPLGRSLRAAVRAFMRAKQLTCVTTTSSDLVFVLFFPLEQEPERVFALATELSQTAAETLGMAVDVGVSAAGRGPLAVSRGFAQAEDGLHFASSIHVAGAGVFDSLDPQRRLVANQSVETLQAVVEKSLGQLLRYDAAHRTRLLATIQAYIDAGCRVGATARALNVHRNTLRQRINRVEQLNGLRVDNIDDIVNLVLGFRALDQLQCLGHHVEHLPECGAS
jgi:PucR family transcriptional regulator, purine catabolism regulatory protein